MTFRDDGEIVLVFKKRPSVNDAENCIKLAMEILNLSQNFSTNRAKGRKPGKKMNKTQRIREGVNSLVNKEGVNPGVVDKLISHIRMGKIKKISTTIDGRPVTLTANEDIAEVITNLFLRKAI